MVNRDDVDSMKNLMNLVNNVPDPSNPNTKTSKASSLPSKDPEMDKFLQSVNLLTEGMTHAAQSADYTSDHDYELKEALETKKTSNGVQIGKWNINIREEPRSVGKKKDKFYDIVHERSGDVVAKDLCVYEAAHGIVRLMNKGKAMNSPEVMSLLEEDQRFFSHREDARTFILKSLREEKRNNFSKQDLYEARLDYSKEKAQKARQKISSLIQSI